MSVIMILIIDGMIGEGKNLSESRPAIIHYRADLESCPNRPLPPIAIPLLSR
jgi:hypothetical protein